MNEKTESSFHIALERDLGNIDNETVVKSNSDLFEKNSEKISGIQEDISFKETFGNTNVVDNQLHPEVLKEVGIFEPKNDPNLLQSEKNAVLLNEKTLNKLTQESIEIIDKEKIDKCINTNEKTIEDTKIEDNFNISDDLQNRENNTSSLAKNNVDTVCCENEKKTVPKQKAEFCVEETTIQCEKVSDFEEESILYQCESSNLKKSSSKSKDLDKDEEFTLEPITVEKAKTLVSLKEVNAGSCEKKVMEDKNDSSTSQQDKITHQTEELTGKNQKMILCTEKTTTDDSTKKIMETENVLLVSQQEKITSQIKELAGKNEESMLFIEKSTSDGCKEKIIETANVSLISQQEKNEEIMLFTDITTTDGCKEKIMETENVSLISKKEKITSQIEEFANQNKEMLVLMENAFTDNFEDNTTNKSLSSNQNEKMITAQIEELTTVQNEKLAILKEEENINQSKNLMIHNKHLTKSQEEKIKTVEVPNQDTVMTENIDPKIMFPSESESVIHSDKKKNYEEEKETQEEVITIKQGKGQHFNSEEIDSEKNETCNVTLNLIENDNTENFKQIDKKMTFEKQKLCSEESFTENKGENTKEETHENLKIINFVDLHTKQTENNEIEQIQLELESKSLTESISSSKIVQNDIQNDSQTNDQFKSSLETLNKETSNSYFENQEKNSNLHELINSQNSVSISNIVGEHEEEENNSNKSENENTEIMDTEIVNCNEFENVDLNENEMQKEKEIDRIGVESSDVDLKNEEVINDSCESNEKFNLIGNDIESKESSNTQDELMLIDDNFNNSDVCENETITGDACNQLSVSVNDEEEDICIIPDNGTPKVSILPENKNKRQEETNENFESNKTSAKKIKTSEAEKVKLRSEERNSEIIQTKSRPLRNAAKLAGNKIKSLVLNDMVMDENSFCNNVKGEGASNANSQEMCRECAQCKEVKVWKFLMVQGNKNKYLCSEQCSELFAKANQIEENFSETEMRTGEFLRKCAQCHSQVTINDKSLFWETMDFCNEDCLGKYQTELGSNCANCKGNVASISLGKYCVRFGSDIKQFCSVTCLEEYKKGLKVCSYCQKDISTGIEGFLAPVGDKGQFKDFCTQFCMEKYERMCSGTPQLDVVEECAVCSNSKPVRVEVELDGKTHKLCSEPCFAAFKFVNNITEGSCDMCKKYFDRIKTGNFFVFYDENLRSFCCKTCMNVYILANRKIVRCNWCKVKKYNFDMIKKVSATGQLLMMCSLNCLMLYQASVNAVCSRRVKCDFCMSLAQAQYHLTMSDATIRNFCSYTCVMSFQVLKKKLNFGTGEDRSNIILEFFAMRYKNNRYPKQAIDLISGTEQMNSPTPTGGPKRIISSLRPQVESTCVPVISSVQSLAPPNTSGRVPLPITDVNVMTQVTPLQQPLTIPTTVEIGSAAVTPMPAPPTPQIYQQIITKPPPAKQMKNKSILCKPYSHTKGVSCRPHPCLKDTQTDQNFDRKCLIPIPVPIYVPTPMHMFATPFPVPVPFPLPVPVPIFIPTTRNSAKGIFKEIKKIQEKIPTDPFEAELLMMAEMVAGEKKQDPTDSESEEGNEGDDNGDETFSPENVDTSNTFGDDMLQMALKMASELEEPAVDMESVLTSNTITTSTQPPVDPSKALYDQVNVMSMNRGRKRSVRGSRNSTGGTPSKRGRRSGGSVDVPLLPPPEPVPPPRIEVEKPDANMCLKYTFGVNAWRHWVMQKNAELEKAALTNRKIKLFKPELLQLTADELNFSLCLFVKEVRKPNGTEYAPDTIYYFCLGIQQYLFENGRIDNIFTDTYYEKFTDCLDEVAKKFATLYNSQYIVTRVEEEHLWESKQLGAHSPHVLLSTLMFFNTKHFNLVTVEEHMQLSFSHIMKHWKRNPNTPGVAKVPGSRNVLLRFYPPQSALEANSRKKKVYEQQENEENPLRCPVKLYEFYLSKCPESVKTRNDVFYLLPERSCVPDSPVWYSTMALGKEPLMKMLHRVKMVKEINIALLTC